MLERMTGEFSFKFIINKGARTADVLIFYLVIINSYIILKSKFEAFQ